MKVFSYLAALLFGVLFATGAAAQITVRPLSTDAVTTTVVRFTTDHAINTISDPIPACLGSMKVFFNQATSSAVSLYPADDTDDTFAELEANTLLASFTSTSSATLSSLALTSKSVRFVVDTAETSGASEAKIICSNVAGGDVGGPQPTVTAATDDGAIIYSQTTPADVTYGVSTTWGFPSEFDGTPDEINNRIGWFYNKGPDGLSGAPSNQFEHGVDANWEWAYRASATGDETWVEWNVDFFPAENASTLTGISGFNPADGEIVTFSGGGQGYVVDWSSPVLTWRQDFGTVASGETVTGTGGTATMGSVTYTGNNSKIRPDLMIYYTNQNKFQRFMRGEHFFRGGTEGSDGVDTATNPALDVQYNFSGTGTTARDTPAFRIASPTELGSSPTIAGFYRAMEIQDQRGDQTGNSGGFTSNSIVVVKAQTCGGVTCDDGFHNNVMFEGANAFNWNTGHLAITSNANSGDHLWRDQTNEVWRTKSDGAPTSETDGSQILTGGLTTSDPCGASPEGYVFYNNTSDYYCFCNGAGDDVRVHAPASACF